MWTPWTASLHSTMMSFVVKVCLVALLSVLAESKVEFEQMEKDSVDDLQLRVAFPEKGFEDVMHLRRYYLTQKDELERIAKCNFVGHLESNAKASIALTGCPGQDEVKITILSYNPPIRKMFLWKLNDEVEELKEVMMLAPRSHWGKNPQFIQKFTF